jgi:hypothetical protein
MEKSYSACRDHCYREFGENIRVGIFELGDRHEAATVIPKLTRRAKSGEMFHRWCSDV